MDRYRVELASPAVRAYKEMHRFTAGEGDASVDRLKAVDRLIDEILPINPSAVGVRTVEGVYWVSEKSVHLFYDVFSDLRLTVVLCILHASERLEAVRKADLMITQMCMLGKLAIMPDRQRYLRPAASN